jgi:hypothetical protein
VNVTRLARCAAVFAACALAPRAAFAQQLVTVTVRAAVGFTVRDVSISTSSSPATTQITYANPIGWLNSQKLRISVQADASSFSGPGTTHIAASKVSWTASSSKGTASNGTLAGGAYTQVYASPANLTGLRSGTHTLTVRCRFEAF